MTGVCLTGMRLEPCVARVEQARIAGGEVSAGRWPGFAGSEDCYRGFEFPNEGDGSQQCSEHGLL